jgi:L-amino acid N-acyltransferase YncA
MESEKATELNHREGFLLIANPRTRSQHTPRLRRKSKHQEQDQSNGLRGDKRRFPEKPSSINATCSNLKRRKALKHIEPTKQNHSIVDSTFTPAEAAKRKWANSNPISSPITLFSKKVAPLREDPSSITTEIRKPQQQRRGYKYRKVSKMATTYIPPHLRPKTEHAPTQPHADLTLSSDGALNVVLNGALEDPLQSSLPMTKPNGNGGALSELETIRHARLVFRLQSYTTSLIDHSSFAIHGKQSVLRRVRMDELTHNEPSSLPQYTADNTPNGNPDRLTTSDDFRSTPTEPTVFTHLVQSPRPKVTNPPASTSPIPSAKAENRKSKPKEALVIGHDGKGAHRSKQPSGWLTKEEKKAIQPREIDGEPKQVDWEEDNWDSNNVQNLVDWEGNWLPAPVEWEGRRAFKRHNYFESIADWVDEVNFTIVHMPAEKNRFTYVPKKIMAMGELFTSANRVIAPREWIPTEVDNQTLQTYWRNLQASNLQLVDVEDAGAIPFWHLYHGNDSDFQVPLEVPDAELDPGDEEEHKGMYRKGKSSENTSNEHIKKQERLAKMAEQEKKAALRNERRRIKELRQMPLILPPPDPNRPKVNMYLRPATLDDAFQMVELYNWYVENTSHVSEMVPLSVQSMQSRLECIERNALPSILAILKSNENRVRGSRPALHTTNEHIVGFAYANDYESRESSRRFCAEIEVYIHQEYLGKGVGKSLLDRMMWMLDPQYKSQDLVEWRVDPDNIAWSVAGGRRIINTLFANATFDSDDKSRLIWISRWLEQFGFVKKAELDDCGIKLGHA